jgi:hypothetical protein
VVALGNADLVSVMGGLLMEKMHVVFVMEQESVPNALAMAAKM